MSGTEYKQPRMSDGPCPSRDDGYNCRLSHSLDVRISTLETTVRNAMGTYDPLIPLSDRIRENISSIAETASHSKYHVKSLLEGVQKLEDNSHTLSLNFSTLKNNVVSVAKSYKYHSESVAKLLDEHQTIVKSLQNEEVCRQLANADLANVKQDRDELYDKYETLKKDFDDLSKAIGIESATRAASESTTRRIFAVAGAVVTLICTIISVVVPFLVK